MICEVCGKEILEDWRKDRKARKTPLRFCSRKCSNVRTQPEEQKQKISDSVKNAIKSHFDKGSICQKCGNVFHTNDFSRKLCFDCLPRTIRYTSVKRKVPTSILEVSKRTLSKILRRMELPCSCCGIYVKGVVWDIHHIIPKKNGGKDNAENLTYICPNCHRIAHTDYSLLGRPLVSMVDQLNKLGVNWLNYYYGVCKK